MSFVAVARPCLPFAPATVAMMAAVMTLLACDNPGDGAAADAESLARQAVIRDSAGIRIVENPRPPAQNA